MVIFTVGELFDSLAALQEKILAYSEANFCHFYVKDSKKLQPEEIINPDLVYKHIAYSCIYGGQKARFRGTGTRSVASIRHGCCSGIYLRVTRDRQHLQVRNFVDVHNHEVTEESYRSASQDRRLPWDLKLEIEELLLLGVDKDRLIEYIRNTSGKNVDKKHLFNVYETAVKHQREITRDRALSLLQKVYGVDTEQEADDLLNLLLENSRPPRRHRKSVQMQQENEEQVQITYFNDEGDETNGGEMGDELQRIMGTLQGSDTDRIVIVEGDEQYEVIEADPSMEAEYLEEDERESEEVNVKQEQVIMRDDESVVSNVSGRFRQFMKRPVTKPRPVAKYISQDHYETSPKVRRVSMPQSGDESDCLLELRKETVQLEKEKLSAEVEMLKLQRNKLARDIAKIDLEKSKLYLEIDLYKQQKKYIMDKQQATELKKEKLRLEINKLKSEK